MVDFLPWDTFVRKTLWFPHAPCSTARAGGYLMNYWGQMGITGALSLTSPAAKSLKEADITEHAELDWSPKPCSVPHCEQAVFKASPKFTLPFCVAQGRGAYVSGAEESSVGQEGGMEHPMGLLDTGGDRTSVPKFGINVFQVPLEAVAFQLLPQLHSALDTVGRKYHRDTMEMVKVRATTPKREAERNPSEMRRQQTQEHQQLWFLFAWAGAVVLISPSLEVSLGKVEWWHIVILTRSLELKRLMEEHRHLKIISKKCMLSPMQ